MKKGIIATFMVALMLITVLSGVVSVNAISISKETIEDKKTDNISANLFPDSFLNRKIFTDCRIKTGLDGCTGIAFLFPKFFESHISGGINTNGASGIIIHGSDPYGADNLWIDGVEYGGFKLMYVFSYSGDYENGWYVDFIHYFDLDGTAKFLILL